MASPGPWSMYSTFHDLAQASYRNKLDQQAAVSALSNLAASQSQVDATQNAYGGVFGQGIFRNELQTRYYTDWSNAMVAKLNAQDAAAKARALQNTWAPTSLIQKPASMAPKLSLKTSPLFGHLRYRFDSPFALVARRFDKWVLSWRYA